MSHDYAEQIQSARGDADALYRIATELHGMVRVLRDLHPAKPSRRPSVSAGAQDDAVPRATWLTPYALVWEKEAGGIFPAGQAIKPLKALLQKYPEAEITRNLGYYLRGLVRANELKYASFPKFAQTFKTHNPDAPAFEDE